VIDDSFVYNIKWSAAVLPFLCAWPAACSPSSWARFTAVVLPTVFCPKPKQIGEKKTNKLSFNEFDAEEEFKCAQSAVFIFADCRGESGRLGWKRIFEKSAEVTSQPNRSNRPAELLRRHSVSIKPELPPIKLIASSLLDYKLSHGSLDQNIKFREVNIDLLSQHRSLAALQKSCKTLRELMRQLNHSILSLLNAFHLAPGNRLVTVYKTFLN
jgi:hypothetical protein